MSLRKNLFAASLIFFVGIPNRTCINEIDPQFELKDTRPLWVRLRSNRVETVVALAKIGGDRERWRGRLEDLDTALKINHGDFALLNDRGAALAHLGRPQEAIAIWLALEERNPGRYEVAANLGTGYELVGDLPNARKWIEEGMRRNPDDHQGTEWLHLRILDAKLNLKSNPSWLKDHDILGMNLESHFPTLPAELPRDNRNRSLDAAGVVHALEYQLQERLQFVGAPDPIVADLLFDWGYFLELAGDLKSAEAAYAQAALYGCVKDKDLTVLRFNLRRYASNKRLTLIGHIFGYAFALILGLLIIRALRSFVKGFQSAHP